MRDPGQYRGTFDEWYLPKGDSKFGGKSIGVLLAGQLESFIPELYTVIVFQTEAAGTTLFLFDPKMDPTRALWEPELDPKPQAKKPIPIRKGPNPPVNRNEPRRSTFGPLMRTGRILAQSFLSDSESDEDASFHDDHQQVKPLSENAPLCSDVAEQAFKTTPESPSEQSKSAESEGLPQESLGSTQFLLQLEESLLPQQTVPIDSSMLSNEEILVRPAGSVSSSTTLQQIPIVQTDLNCSFTQLINETWVVELTKSEQEGLSDISDDLRVVSPPRRHQTVETSPPFQPNEEKPSLIEHVGDEDQSYSLGQQPDGARSVSSSRSLSHLGVVRRFLRRSNEGEIIAEGAYLDLSGTLSDVSDMSEESEHDDDDLTNFDADKTVENDRSPQLAEEARALFMALEHDRNDESGLMNDSLLTSGGISTTPAHVGRFDLYYRRAESSLLQSSATSGDFLLPANGARDYMALPNRSETDLQNDSESSMTTSTNLMEQPLASQAPADENERLAPHVKSTFCRRSPCNFLPVWQPHMSNDEGVADTDDSDETEATGVVWCVIS